MALYKDDDIIAQLENQISNLKLDDDPSAKLIGDFAKGTPKIEGEERQIKLAKRTTSEG